MAGKRSKVEGLIHALQTVLHELQDKTLALNLSRDDSNRWCEEQLLKMRIEHFEHAVEDIQVSIQTLKLPLDTWYPSKKERRDAAKEGN